ncbi:MAG: cell division protein ZapA [Alphaproteobacteria bacterium]
MSEVTVKINQRGYGISCGEGQEQRIGELGAYVDSRLQDIAAAGAASNDSHLFVLTSLVLADEIYELREQLGNMQQQMNQVQAHHGQVSSGISHEDEALIVQAIEHLASKIENIAGRVENQQAEQGEKGIQHA